MNSGPPRRPYVHDDYRRTLQGGSRPPPRHHGPPRRAGRRLRPGLGRKPPPRRPYVHDDHRRALQGFARLHDIMARHVAHGAAPGLGRKPPRRDRYRRHRRDRPRRPPGRAARHDLPHLVDDQARHRGRDADPARGVRAEARRAGRAVPARTGRPARRAPHRRAGRRHGAGQPADHRARPAHLPHGLRRVLRALPGQRCRRAAAAERGPAAAVPAARPPTSGCGGSRRCR